LRTQYESVQRQTGKTPAALAEIPEIPDALVYLWNWFCELDAARGGSGFGINPLSYNEIKAWATLMGVQPAPWEVAAIKRIDSVRIRVANEKRQDS
jgi:hypothetical protein